MSFKTERQQNQLRDNLLKRPNGMVENIPRKRQQGKPPQGSCCGQVQCSEGQTSSL